MPVHTGFISAFLTRMEERHTVAYIPCGRKNFDGHNKAADCGEPVGQSGVTIGAGLDLGQQGEADLRRMGLDSELIGIFRPYLGSPFPSRSHTGYPALYGHLCRGYWQAAALELKTGFKKYACRRRQEGELLEGSI